MSQLCPKTTGICRRFLIIRGYFRRDWNRFLLDGSIRKPRRYKQLPRRAPSTPSPPSLDAEHDSFGFINESLAAAAMMLLDPHDQKDSSDLFVIKITLLGDRQVDRLVFWERKRTRAQLANRRLNYMDKIQLVQGARLFFTIWEGVGDERWQSRSHSSCL